MEESVEGKTQGAGVQEKCRLGKEHRRQTENQKPGNRSSGGNDRKSYLLKHQHVGSCLVYTFVNLLSLSIY